jgi:Uma2 family endonuclease
MVLTVEEIYLPMTLTAVPGLSDAEFDALCQKYPDCRLECTAEGDVIVMPPTDPDTGIRNSSIGRQLANWAESSPGHVTASSAGFKLPNGARRSPDAAWISRNRLRSGMCPEFVIELLSPGDRLLASRGKMNEWIQNGVELGWMMDPRAQSVTIFRQNREPEVRADITEIGGEGSVAGFVLDPGPIWRTYSTE